MDLNSITDIRELKALAYDELASKEHAERNLALLNQRIATLMQQEAQAQQSVSAPEDSPQE